MGKKRRNKKGKKKNSQPKPVSNENALDDFLDFGGSEETEEKTEEIPNEEPKKEEPIEKNINQEEKKKVKEEIEKEEEEEAKGEETEPKASVPQKYKSVAKKVSYCSVCGLPNEFCEFHEDFDKRCGPALKETNPSLFEKLVELRKKKGTKKIKKKKRKENKDKIVNVVLQKRNGKKTITAVAGLELFGFELKPIKKQLQRKFSSSVSMTKDETYGEMISIQGDFVDDIVEMCEKKWNIPKKSIVTSEMKAKGRKPNKRPKRARGGKKGADPLFE